MDVLALTQKAICLSKDTYFYVQRKAIALVLAIAFLLEFELK